MNISLIGMMGSGKSTIAKILREKLDNFSLVDTDSLIVEQEKVSINRIFADKGEDYFRIIESQILNDVLKKDNQIISTGGGIVVKDSNLNLLKDNSIVFFLSADDSILFDRVKNNNERPLLNDVDIKERIKNLLCLRLSQYEKAHYTIDTNYKTPETVANEIIRKLGLDANH